jgi:hypothetical protein
MVYFRFEGKRRTGVESVDVSIPKLHLKAFPETLLAKLAEDTWKSDKEAGETTIDKPIITDPLEGPCAELWSPDLAQLIVDVYRYQYHQEKETDDSTPTNGSIGIIVSEVYQPPESLVPRPVVPFGVELDNVLVVLDFYGFPMKPEERIQVKLQKREFELMEKAQKYVLAELEKNPHRETLFLFASHTADMNYIHRVNDTSRIKRPWCHKTQDEILFIRTASFSSGQFVRVGGSSPECAEHFAWSHVACLREHFLASLQKELASFSVRYLWLDLASGDELPLPKQDFCWVATRDNNDLNITMRYETEELLVLQVSIPVEESPRKRSRSG